MDNIKIAILKSFENVVKSILEVHTESALMENVKQVSKQVNELRDRISFLESMNTYTLKSEPLEAFWNCTHKNEVVDAESSSISEESNKYNDRVVIDDKSTIVDLRPYANEVDTCEPDIIETMSDVEESPTPVAEPPQPVVEPSQPVVEPSQPVVEESPTSVKEPPQSVVEQPKPAVEPPQPTVKETNDNENNEEEEEQEVEEEEELALEEIEFKGKTYYRDEEGLIYSVDDDGELIQDPVGRWSEKTQSVRFFTK